MMTRERFVTLTLALFLDPLRRDDAALGSSFLFILRIRPHDIMMIWARF